MRYSSLYDLKANRVDPDQMSYSAGSELGLHCLDMSTQKRGSSLNRDNQSAYSR